MLRIESVVGDAATGPCAEREITATLSGLTEDELADRDAMQSPVARWIAFDDVRPVGVATAFVRPDDRLFVVHRVRDPAAWAPLTARAAAETPGATHVTVDRDDAERISAARDLGFVVDARGESYEVPFDTCLAAVAAVAPSTAVVVRSVHDVDPEALFALDTALRNDTPGTAVGGATGRGSTTSWPARNSTLRPTSLPSISAPARRSD